ISTKLKNDFETSIGIKIGFVQSGLYGDDLEALSANGKSSVLSGLTIGVVANSIIEKHFGLKHELNFNTHGAKIELHENAKDNFSSKLRMSSLQLHPASPAFYYNGFQLYVGPYISALINASIMRKDEDGSFYKDESIYGNARED